MNLQGQRVSLSILWTSGFVLAITGVLYLRWVVPIGATAASDLFDLLIGQYAPYLGSVLGFQFALRGSHRRTTKAEGAPYWLAMAMSGLWNLIILGFLAQACFNSDTTQSDMKDIKAVVPKLTWIVAPAIGFFFGKPGNEP
jgi:hypothetical protein